MSQSQNLTCARGPDAISDKRLVPVHLLGAKASCPSKAIGNEGGSVTSIDLEGVLDLLRQPGACGFLRLGCDLPLIGSSTVVLNDGQLSFGGQQLLPEYWEHGPLTDVLLLCGETSEVEQEAVVEGLCARGAHVYLFREWQALFDQYPLLDATQFQAHCKEGKLEGYTNAQDDYAWNCIEEVIPGLFIGNYRAAQDCEMLREKNVHSVLTVANNLEDLELAGSFRHTTLAVDDEELDISAVFQQAWEFIRHGRENNEGVLVHCAAGANRSATVVLSWLIKEEGMTAYEAFEQLWRCRPIVGPRAQHCACLVELERRERQTSSMQVICMEPSYFVHRDQILYILGTKEL